jgi:hypothetical protein
LFVRIKTKNTTADMKKLFLLSMLIPLTMVCSCQKQNTAAEQLAQRKVELDTREKALDEREKALAERERAVAHAAMLPADRQLRALKKDAASDVAPSATIPPGLAPPDNSQLKASREKRVEELRALRQHRLEALQRMRSNMRAQPNSGGGTPADSSASGNTSGSSDTSTPASTGAEATSPSPSSTPQ